MKRQNLTAIIGKVQILTYRVHHFGLSNDYNQRIRKAAVNEINRLEAEREHEIYSDGYDKGFECARLVERTNINCDCLGVTDNQERICGNLKPIQP